MSGPSSKFLPVYLALLFVIFIWGINFVVMKITFSVLDPLAFNGVRMTLALSILLGMLLIREGWQPIPIRDAVKLVALGLAGNGLFQIVIITGLHLSRPENASLFHATIPVWSALIVWLLGWERITWRGWAGILLSFVGVALVIYATSEGFSLGSGSTLLGDLLISASAVLWACYTVFSKDLLKKYSPLRVSALALASGLPLIWLVTLPNVFTTDWSSVPLWALGAILFSGTFAIAINYMIWSVGVQKVGAARTAIFQNLSPVITFIAAYFTLQEPVFLLQVIGGAIVLFGVWMTIRAK